MEKVESFLAELAEVLQTAPGDVNSDSVLDPKVWDSLAIVSTIALLDEHFGRVVDGTALEGCRTVSDILKLAEGKH